MTMDAGIDSPLGTVAVVVPTHGRAPLVEQLLVSLDHARVRFSGEVEVLIVDSSSGEQRERIARACTNHSARHLTGPLNVRQKRNLGAQATAADHLAFVDSDCRVTPDFFVRHAEALARTPMAAGSVGLTQFTGPETWVSRLVSLTPFVDAFSFAETMDFVPWSTMTNIVLPRSDFHGVGGFDEDFPFRLGGDDVDLTWRLTVSGTVLVAAPDAVVHHDRATWSRLRDVFGRVWRWGRVDHHLERKHPAQLVRTVPRMPAWLLLLAGAMFMQVAQSWGTASTGALLLGVLAVAVAERRVEPSPRPPWVARPLISGLRLLFSAGRGFEAIRRGRLPSPFRRLVFDHPAFPGDVNLRWQLEPAAQAAWSWVIGLVTLMLVGA